MEVKIGVQHAHRELVLESTQSPAEKIAYVEIAEATTRMVGFTAGS